MRLTVVHDIQGNIVSIAASPPESPVVYLETKPGQRVTEIDAPDLAPNQSVEYVREHLTNLMKDHRVLIEHTEGRLTKEAPRKAKKPSA